EAVFAIENHAVAAIEKDHRGAGTVVFALMHHQVRVGHFDGNFRAFTADSVEERGTNVHVERVAEFIGARDAAGFDSGGKVAGVVAAKAAAAKRAEQVLQSLEAQKIDGLIGDFKARFGLAVLRLAEPAARGGVWRRRDLRRLLRINEAFVAEALDELFEVDGVGRLAYVFAVANEFHTAISPLQHRMQARNFGSAFLCALCASALSYLPKLRTS